MLRTLRRRTPVIGPEDNGRRMTLDEFDRAIGRDGYVYELNKGVVEVTEVPHPRHGEASASRSLQFAVYQEANPG